MRPAELHSPSAEENCMTENVASLRSVKGATLPCAAYAAIPCGLAVRKQHEMLFAASKFEKPNTENQTVDWSHYAKSRRSFFIPKIKKGGHEKMAKLKTLEHLRAEKERAETQLAQEQHKLNRLENRKKYLEKGERQKRTHRLCNLGGTIESLAPEVKDLTRTEMTELMEHIFSLSEVQRAVWHMAITHTNQANREKELKADGTISSERHAD